MGNQHRRRGGRGLSWRSLKDDGTLTERYVLMAMALGFDAETLLEAHRSSADAAALVLPLWLEDRHFEKFGTVVPVDEAATPLAQQEHAAENSLLPDPVEIIEKQMLTLGIEPGSEEELDWDGDCEDLIRVSERNTPVSYGEIEQQDRAMLRRQEEFRKAARALTAKLALRPDVRKVVLFGSTALPLWKEVPRFFRLRTKSIKIYHECANIDLAVWVTATSGAPEMRKACAAVVNELVEKEIHFSIAAHYFCLHLVDAATGSYLGMVCHYNQCPKHKPACDAPGCGQQKFVQILPWFKFLPGRLDSRNSQVLYEAAEEK